MFAYGAYLQTVAHRFKPAGLSHSSVELQLTSSLMLSGAGWGRVGRGGSGHGRCRYSGEQTEQNRLYSWMPEVDGDGQKCKYGRGCRDKVSGALVVGRITQARQHAHNSHEKV